jgi:hypothetical protein
MRAEVRRPPHALGAAKLREARPAWERAQERLRSRLPKEIWASLLDLLPELTRLADIARFFWHETCVRMFCAGTTAEMIEGRSTFSKRRSRR